MKIQRFLENRLRTGIEAGKITVLYGPRRTGKTTLVKDILKTFSFKSRYANGDELPVREIMSSQNSETLNTLLAENDLLIIDEAQRIQNIGLNLKILVDNHPDKYILATGSASFDLANKINEPLTGRKNTLLLYPISFGELVNSFGMFDAVKQLERWLVWGTYPEVVTIEDPQKRKSYLDELTGSYLYKDILELAGVRHPEKIINILRLLAFQIGQEVSIPEIASNVALNRETVERYLDLLEKSFVIFRRGGFSRNLRKEIVKNNRYYFFDNGIRNSLIQNFNPLTIRNDMGQLWENFLIVERLKTLEYTGISVNSYFWRTYDQKEIDLIEEREGKIFAYECKWQGVHKNTIEKEFTAAYPDAQISTINKDNFRDFLTIKK